VNGVSRFCRRAKDDAVSKFYFDISKIKTDSGASFSKNAASIAE
jgi:hypothetical protein